MQNAYVGARLGTIHLHARFMHGILPAMTHSTSDALKRKRPRPCLEAVA